VQKPKNFLAFFSRLLPPPLHREAEKEMERKLLVLLRRIEKSSHTCYYNTVSRNKQQYYVINIWKVIN